MASSTCPTPPASEEPVTTTPSGVPVLSSAPPADANFAEWLELKRQASKQWTWQEANPDVMNPYLKAMGLRGCELHELLGTEDMFLDMVPKGCVAVLLLYPYSTKGVSTIRSGLLAAHGVPAPEEEKSTTTSTTTPATTTGEKPEAAGTEGALKATDDGGQQAGVQQPMSQGPHSPWHTFQYVRGACGSVGLLHAAMNVHRTLGVSLEQGSVYASFAQRTASMSPPQRAQCMNDDEAYDQQYQQCVHAEGTAKVVYDSNERLKGLHFTSFVHVAGGLFELDGLCPRPVFHGPTSPEGLLQDAAAAIRKYIACDLEDIRFSMMALCPSA